jgi:uncharacterized GH25 family protein
MKKFITSLLILCAIGVAAHEFWLQPDKFIYNKGETATIKFRVGENFEGDNWNSNRSKINFLTFYTNGITKDVAPFISDNNGDSLRLTLTSDGTAMIAYNGLNSFIELDAAKFNDYLKEDGLTEAIEYRKQHNETEDSSHEFYQRSVKTIIQVGKKYDDTYKQKTNLPVDIIPQSHPYQLKDGKEVSFKILFQQKPLTNHLIKIWHRVNNKTVYSDKMSDEKGQITLPITTTGKWMVSTVKMVRLKNDPKAKWQSYWGSCTWGHE